MKPYFVDYHILDVHPPHDGKLQQEEDEHPTVASSEKGKCKAAEVAPLVDEAVDMDVEAVGEEVDQVGLPMSIRLRCRLPLYGR
jgi:hypothetical protein